MPEDYDFDDDSLNDDGDRSTGTNPLKELRTQNRRLAKELKEAKQASDELNKFKVEYELRMRADNAAKIFSDLGLPAAQAKAYVKLFPDTELTPDSVKDYAREFGLAVTEESSESAEEKVDDFRPISAGGSSPVKTRLTYEDYSKLLESNPTAALQAVAENRVEGMQSTPRD